MFARLLSRTTVLSRALVRLHRRLGERIAAYTHTHSASSTRRERHPSRGEANVRKTTVIDLGGIATRFRGLTASSHFYPAGRACPIVFGNGVKFHDAMAVRLDREGRRPTPSLPSPFPLPAAPNRGLRQREQKDQLIVRSTTTPPSRFGQQVTERRRHVISLFSGTRSTTCLWQRSKCSK